MRVGVLRGKQERTRRDLAEKEGVVGGVMSALKVARRLDHCWEWVEPAWREKEVMREVEAQQQLMQEKEVQCEGMRREVMREVMSEGMDEVMSEVMGEVMR